MEKHDKKLLLDHEYDGIQELDNPLPGWWLATFYGAVIFAFLYVGYYHFGGPGRDSREDLAQSLSDIKMNQELASKNAPLPDEAFLLAAFADPQRLAAGNIIFTEKCASCHASDGGGMIGPNLTDKFWIHGDGSLPAILQVTSEGVADKGMPPWKALLKPDEVISVVVYAKSLQGKKPITAKEPQGVEIK